MGSLDDPFTDHGLHPKVEDSVDHDERQGQGLNFHSWEEFLLLDDGDYDHLPPMKSVKELLMAVDSKLQALT